MATVAGHIILRWPCLPRDIVPFWLCIVYNGNVTPLAHQISLLWLWIWL
jgi:hypothetical protein